MIALKVVLTGGPCAGKSTGISKVSKHLRKLGYTVYIAHESATKLINQGIKPFGDNKIDMLTFQEMVLNQQMAMEKIYELVAKSKDEKCVIICDRGIMDNASFIGKDDFDDLLKRYHLSVNKVLSSYDMVIHLVTTADGAIENYTLLNNQARSENAEEAREQDMRLRKCWSGHNNMKIVGNYGDFDDKMDRVISYIDNYLAIPKMKRVQRKFLVEKNDELLNYLEGNAQKIVIKNIYFKGDVEKRVKITNIDGDLCYYYTEQIKGANGVSSIIKEKVINENDFYRLISKEGVYDSIQKIRYVIICDKQKYQVDVYDDMVILEADVTLQDIDINVPDEFDILKEVTGEDDYLNVNLARKREMAMVKKKKL